MKGIYEYDPSQEHRGVPWVVFAHDTEAQIDPDTGLPIEPLYHTVGAFGTEDEAKAAADAVTAADTPPPAPNPVLPTDTPPASEGA